MFCVLLNGINKLDLPTRLLPLPVCHYCYLQLHFGWFGCLKKPVFRPWASASEGRKGPRSRPGFSYMIQI